MWRRRFGPDIGDGFASRRGSPKSRRVGRRSRLRRRNGEELRGHRCDHVGGRAVVLTLQHGVLAVRQERCQPGVGVPKEIRARPAGHHESRNADRSSDEVVHGIAPRCIFVPAHPLDPLRWHPRGSEGQLDRVNMAISCEGRRGLLERPGSRPTPRRPIVECRTGSARDHKQAGRRRRRRAGTWTYLRQLSSAPRSKRVARVARCGSTTAMRAIQ